MATMSGNPYSPPSAQVADIEPGKASILRPPVVTFGLALLWANLAVGIALLIVDSFAVAIDDGSDALPAYLVGAAYSLGVITLKAFVTWHAWKGRNWARLVHLFLLALGVLIAVSTYFALRSVMSQMGGEMPQFIGLWQLLSTAVSAAGVVMLFTPRATGWYRAMKEPR
jgi:hypothetical protein